MAALMCTGPVRDAAEPHMVRFRQEMARSLLENFPGVGPLAAASPAAGTVLGCTTVSGGMGSRISPTTGWLVHDFPQASSVMQYACGHISCSQSFFTSFSGCVCKAFIKLHAFDV
jgi:hypothetical protein